MTYSKIGSRSCTKVSMLFPIPNLVGKNMSLKIISCERTISRSEMIEIWFNLKLEKWLKKYDEIRGEFKNFIRTEREM